MHLFVLSYGCVECLFSNIRGYNQRFSEFSASLLFLYPDFAHLLRPILLVNHQEVTYIFAAHHDHSSHYGGILLLCRDDLLMHVINYEMHDVPEASEIIGVHYQKTMICVCINNLAQLI